MEPQSLMHNLSFGIWFIHSGVTSSNGNQAIDARCKYRYYKGTVCARKFEPPVRSLCVQATRACPTILCLAMVGRDTIHEQPFLVLICMCDAAFICARNHVLLPSTTRRLRARNSDSTSGRAQSL